MVDFSRFMGRGNLEPRFAPMPIATPAPTPVAPPPAPLPSVEPAPMPAPVAPLPNISGLPDLSNIDLSGLPGLPQMPLPAPVAAPAPVPPMEIAPGPLPELVTPPPLPPQLVPPPVPPMEIAPGPVPTPVMPPPLPPQPVPPPVPPMDIAPPPVVPPINIAPPPAVPPIDIAPPPGVPPFEIAPGPVPTPVTPPPLPPREPPGVPPFEIAPGPVPTPVTPPPPPPSMVLPPELQDALTGIETLAPDDFTAPVTPPFSPSEQMGFNALEPQEGPLPAGVVADVIPLPDGNNFNVNEIQPNFGAGMTMGDILLTEPGEVRLPEGVDTTLPDNTVDFGYGAVNVEDLAAIGVPGFGFDAETGEVTFDADQMIGAEGGGTAAAGRSYTPTFDNMYTYPEDDFTFGGGDTGGTTDGTIRDNRFIDTNNNGIDDRDEREDIDRGGNVGGSGTTTTGGSTTTGGTTTTGYGDWYNNLSDQQRAAFDAWMANNANNGVITTPFGTYNINQYTGGGSGTTTITPIESNFEFTAGTPAGSGQNVSVATEYALPGTVAPRAPADNPFVRPETQQGIGSLAGGG